MVTQTNIPTWLTQGDIAQLTQFFDVYMNSKMLFSQLFGIYTGILAVTMWNVAISKSQRTRWPMVVAIILLYITTFIDFIFLLCTFSGYVSHGQNIWTRYLSLAKDHDVMKSVGMGTIAIISTILADSTMIWRCWTVWGQHCLIVVLPSLCLVSGIVFKIIDMHSVFVHGSDLDVHNLVLYAAFSLATTLWCTLLIIYRILSVGRASSGAGGGLRAYWHTIEVLVESSALYSACLIVYVACFANKSWGEDYMDTITGIARGIAPTLLVGRVAAGHAHPDDSWNRSIVSSLHFGRDQSQRGTQNSMFSINLDDDPEAQVDQTDELESESEYIHQTNSQRVKIFSNNIEAQQEEVEIGHKVTSIAPGQ